MNPTALPNDPVFDSQDYAAMLRVVAHNIGPFDGRQKILLGAARALDDERARRIALEEKLKQRDAAADASFDIIRRLERVREWSHNTFGPANGDPTGILAHIRKELDEIAANPRDTEEWIDVVILALDGAWRCDVHPYGIMTPRFIVEALWNKWDKTEKRKWPDWRTAAPGQPIEHIKDAA